MKRTWLVTLFAAASAVSCEDTQPASVPPLNLDRPVDISFACFGEMRVTNGRKTADPADDKTSTAQPVAACEHWSPQATPEAKIPPLPGQEDIAAPNWYGFILQSSTGTVALARWSAVPAQELESLSLLDADPLTPGNNSISIGEEPVAIATDKVGCYEVTANAGSCDLSTLEINSAVDGDPSTPVVVKRQDVYVDLVAMKKLGARPAAMVVEPPLRDDPTAPTTVFGNTCSNQSTGLVYVAYPGCDLVAGIDTATGEIKTGIKLAKAGELLTATVMTAGDIKNLQCFDECNGGAPATKGTVRPVALDLRAFTAEDNTTTQSRLVIGSQGSSSLAVVELDPLTSLPQGAPLVIPLENKSTDQPLGILAVSLSPVISMGGTEGNNDSELTPAAGKGQYVYAVASDGTVRVVDVLDLNQECDTQVDGRLVRTRGDLVTKDLQCFPVGGPKTPARRVGAKSPGIEVPGDGVPTSVVIVHGLDGKLRAPDPMNPSQIVDVPASQDTGIGYFAIIATTAGTNYVVNVDNDFGPDRVQSNDPFATAPALVMAHQLRDAFENRGAPPAGVTADVNAEPACNTQDAAAKDGGTTGGGPRSSAPSVFGGALSAKKLSELPRLRQVTCIGPDALDGTAVSEVQYGAAESVRDEVYPELATILSEAWTLTWEGLLSLDTSVKIVDGPQLRYGQMRIDGIDGMSLLDQTRPFCEMGIEPFDIVQFRGCNPANGTGDCPSGFECFLHPDRRVDTSGVCIPEGEGPRLAGPCKDFLIPRQRFSVARREPGKMVLWPRKRVLSTTPVGGCTGTAPANTSSPQCKAAADVALQMLRDEHPLQLTGTQDSRIWACEADELRAPTGSGKRCVQKCAFHTTDRTSPFFDGKDRDSDCDVGTICAYPTPGAKGPDGQAPLADGTGMESVQPPQACVTGPQRYDVRASEAFTVIGDRTGYVHPIIEKDGQCVRNPAANPLELGRVPLAAPACDPTANPLSGELPAGGFDANPCSVTVAQSEVQPNYDPASATCALLKPETVLKVTDVPAIRFRNSAMTLTLVDPYYQGDKACIGDRQGTLGQIPLVIPGYQLAFGQRAGLTPLALGVDPVFPIKVVRGPSNSIWVMDNGDFLSQTNGVSSTRGRVYRVEPQSFETARTLK